MPQSNEPPPSTFMNTTHPGKVYNLKSGSKNIKFFVLDQYTDPIANAIKQENDGILNEANLLKEFICGGGAFLDIGANLGIDTLVFSAHKIKTYAFEANPMNVLQLAETCSLNEVDAEIIGKAVVDVDGRYRFVNNGPYGFLEKLTSVHKNLVADPVEGVSVDSWFFGNNIENKIEMIKMDVEGAELLALAGMKKMIKANSHPAIFVEFNGWCMAIQSIDISMFFNAFEELGYRPYRIHDKDTLIRIDMNTHAQAEVFDNYLMLGDDSPLLSKKNLLPAPPADDDLFLSKALACTDFTIYYYATAILLNSRLQKHSRVPEFIQKLGDFDQDFIQNIHKKLKTQCPNLICPADRPQEKPFDINQLLHDARSAMLRSMPERGEQILSVGCSGTWYFDWIASRYGPVKRHIGIELYSPKPKNLPPWVDWIANTAADMRGVKSEEVDLVFSGQNLEHLWPDDVSGFFLESWRVLKPGGWLVVDSPNRDITQALCWSHPEHTVEYTPEEAAHLVELAGFDEVRTKGIWLCRDPKTGTMLPFLPCSAPGDWSIAERVIQAVSAPRDSFIWWIEARKSDKIPQPDLLTRSLQEIYQKAWPERASRFLTLDGDIIAGKSGAYARSRNTAGGVLVYGPYMPLPKGPHHAVFEVVVRDCMDEAKSRAVVRCDIMGDKNRIINVVELTADEVLSQDGHIRLDFHLDELEFGIQARCISLGGACIECHLPVLIT